MRLGERLVCAYSLKRKPQVSAVIYAMCHFWHVAKKALIHHFAAIALNRVCDLLLRLGCFLWRPVIIQMMFFTSLALIRVNPSTLNFMKNNISVIKNTLRLI